MILKLVPVLFHLFLYQYVVYWLPVLIRKKNLRNLFLRTAEVLMCQQAVEGAAPGNHILADRCIV